MPALIGRGTLKRVEQGSLAAVALRVPIEAPIEAEIDLVVDDGDNPPLDVRAITAEFAELPWIYFEAPEGALAARYGNPSLPAPKYDLEAARPALRIETATDAAWGVPRARTADENAVNAASPMPTVGAPVDAGTSASCGTSRRAMRVSSPFASTRPRSPTATAWHPGSATCG